MTIWQGIPKAYSLARERWKSERGGNIRRQENRAGWMEVLIRPTSRAIWLGQQKKKNGLISKTNYIPFRFSFGTCPNQSQRPQSKRFKWAVRIFLLSASFTLSSYFHLSAADTSEFRHTLDEWQMCMCKYSRLLLSPKLKLSCFSLYEEYLRDLMWYLSQDCNAKQIWAKYVMQLWNPDLIFCQKKTQSMFFKKWWNNLCWQWMCQSNKL